MNRDSITNARVDSLLSTAGLYEQADELLPLTVTNDLMREGVFLSLEDYNDGE